LVEQIFQAVVMTTFAWEVSMSEYVEARYARLVLREARLSEEDVANLPVEARFGRSFGQPTAMGRVPVINRESTLFLVRNHGFQFAFYSS
jgi:hypothetical protein